MNVINNVLACVWQRPFVISFGVCKYNYTWHCSGVSLLNEVQLDYRYGTIHLEEQSLSLFDWYKSTRLKKATGIDRQHFFI